MTTIEIIVLGTPAPQGSKHGYAVKAKGAYTGKVAQVESSAKVKPWRMAVKYAALEEFIRLDSWYPMSGAIILDVVFRLARPKSHYGTGRNAGHLKLGQPWRPNGCPDLDKLLRSTFDALGEAGVWDDDAQVVSVRASKVYADVGLLRTDVGSTGATIKVTSLGNAITEQVA